MKNISVFLLLMSWTFCAWQGVSQQNPPGAQPPAASTPSAGLQTEKVDTRQLSSVPLPALPSEAGYMEPAQVQALLHKIWFATYRINDLLTQVRPQGWKMSDGARNSFHQMLDTLRAELTALEEWRGQFETRTDSMYLGYETSAAIGAVLPRLDGVARSVAEHENPSLAAQYSQAENQLFDLQQALRPYLSYLLRNQDHLLLATQNNLAACQNQLGYAMRGASAPVKPIRNAPPIRPEPRRPRTTKSVMARPKEKSGKKAEPASGSSKKVVAAPPSNPPPQKP